MGNGQQAFQLDRHHRWHEATEVIWQDGAQRKLAAECQLTGGGVVCDELQVDGVDP